MNVLVLDTLPAAVHAVWTDRYALRSDADCDAARALAIVAGAAIASMTR